jgi:hypothetical protein
MRLPLLAGLLAILLGMGLLSSGERVSAQTDSPTPAPQTNGTSDAGEVNLDPPDALTSFTVSNPYCFQPDPAVDKCQINLRYVQANDNLTSSPYLTWLTINISGKNRFTATKFFEGSITYSYAMVPEGMTVPCGAPNAGGAGSLYGYVYSVSITPLDSGRNSMGNDSANVTCPAYNP